MMTHIMLVGTWLEPRLYNTYFCYCLAAIDTVHASSMAVQLSSFLEGYTRWTHWTRLDTPTQKNGGKFGHVKIYDVICVTENPSRILRHILID